jgi:hypothetical protein
MLMVTSNPQWVAYREGSLHVIRDVLVSVCIAHDWVGGWGTG